MVKWFQGSFLLLLALCCLCAAYLFYQQAYHYDHPHHYFISDMPAIMGQARDIQRGVLTRPHMGLQYTAIGLADILPLRLDQALLLTLILCYALKVTAIYGWLCACLRPGYSLRAIACVTAGLLLVAPLYLPAFNPHIVSGQAIPNQWDNPTMTASIPFALLSFAGFVYALEKGAKLPLNLALALVLFLSAWMKPSFLFIFLPAAPLYMLCYHKRSPAALATYAAMAVPSALLLLWQFKTFFVSNPTTQPHSMFIDILGPWQTKSPIPFVSMLLSAAFPIAATFCFPKAMSRQSAFAWILWTVAAIQGLVFAEGPPHFYKHMNFVRGFFAATLILFITTTIDTLRHLAATQGRLTPAARCCIALWLLHVATGAYYLATLLSGWGYE